MKTLVLSLLLITSAASAQTAPATDAGPPDILGIAPPPRPAEHKLSFSFSEGVGRGDPLCIPINIAGKDHLFLVDTGFPGTAVDLALAKENPAVFGTENKPVTVTAMHGAETSIAIFKAPPLRAGGELLRTVNSEIAALDMAMLREATGRPVEGVLGFDVLSGYIVRIDFERRTFDLIDSPGFDPPNDPKTSSFPIKRVSRGNPGIVIPIAGVPDVTVTIDTGGDMTFSLTRDLLQKMTGANPASRPGWNLDAAGTATTAEFLVPQKWSLAGTSYQNLWIEEASFNCVGLRALATYVATFDFPQQRAYFRPLRDAFPPQRPRLEFGITSKEGRYFVKFAAEPATKLDIQIGDEIIALDGKPVDKLEIWLLREQLREAKSAVTTLRRDGKNREITLRHDD